MQIVGSRTEPTAAVLGLVGIVRALGWLPEAVTDDQLIGIASGLGAFVVYFGAQRVKRSGNGEVSRPTYADVRMMVRQALRQEREESKTAIPAEGTVDPMVIPPPEPKRSDPIDPSKET